MARQDYQVGFGLPGFTDHLQSHISGEQANLNSSELPAYVRGIRDCLDPVLERCSQSISNLTPSPETKAELCTTSLYSAAVEQLQAAEDFARRLCERASPLEVIEMELLATKLAYAANMTSSLESNVLFLSKTAP